MRALEFAFQLICGTAAMTLMLWVLLLWLT